MNLILKQSRAMDVSVISIAVLRNWLFLVGGNAGNACTNEKL